MLYYDRINVSGITDVNERRTSNKCDICHYWYFLSYIFKVQLSAYNRYDNLLMISMNLSGVAAF